MERGLLATTLAALAFVTVPAGATSLTTLYTFSGGNQGAYPNGGVIMAAGTLYGTASRGGSFGRGVLFQINADNGTLRVAHHFGSGTDGAYPLAALVQGAPGTMYGTTEAGGRLGYGTVFKISLPSGHETVLHDFTGADGASPEAAVLYRNSTVGTGSQSGLLGGAPTLYGTTVAGGAFHAGTIFKIDLSTGTETVLHDFTGGTDGAYPVAGLVQVFDRLYGTTSAGGALAGGTLFALDLSTGRETTLHDFVGVDYGVGGSLGALVYAGGFLYGTTFGVGPLAMGATCQAQLCGTIFRIAPGGSAMATLYSFGGATDGAFPSAGLTVKGGALYGTTFYGGGNWCFTQWGGCGTIFKIDPASGVETALYRFTGGSDGENPSAQVTERGGVLFGTTSGSDDIYGCTNGCGTVFKLTP
jgi:uncharacterized repeat protein (TIGR03803 family)